MSYTTDIAGDYAALGGNLGYNDPRVLHIYAARTGINNVRSLLRLSAIAATYARDKGQPIPPDLFDRMIDTERAGGNALTSADYAQTGLDPQLTARYAQVNGNVIKGVDATTKERLESPDNRSGIMGNPADAADYLLGNFEKNAGTGVAQPFRDYLKRRADDFANIGLLRRFTGVEPGASLTDQFATELDAQLGGQGSLQHTGFGGIENAGDDQLSGLKSLVDADPNGLSQEQKTFLGANNSAQQRGVLEAATAQGMSSALRGALNDRLNKLYNEYSNGARTGSFLQLARANGLI